MKLPSYTKCLSGLLLEFTPSHLLVASRAVMPETRHFCPHCEENVSLSTIHRHKQLYYDERSHTWMKSTQDDVFSDSEPDQDPAEVIDSPFESSIEGILEL